MKRCRYLWPLPFLLVLILRGYAGAQVKPREELAPKLKSTETAHYLYQSDSSQEVHDEFARVVEAAWFPMKEFFGAEPKLKNDERLRVYFFETSQAWADQLQKDGAVVPPGAGGYYWPPTKTAYLWRQPSVYFTRQLLIHEVIHQFHFLAKCGNVGPKDTWYTEGITEYLSRHFWDGEKLTLGVLPLLSLEDYGRLALETYQAKDFDFKSFAYSERASTRPEQWAFVRYLVTAENGAHKKKWETISRYLDQGQMAKNAFRNVFGEPKALGEKVHEWLKSEQEPFNVIWVDWEGVAPGRFKGSSAVTSACRARNECERIDAAIEVPEGKWRGGVICYDDNENYTVAYVASDGRFTVNRRLDKSWKVLLTGQAPAATDAKLYKVAGQRVAEGFQFVIEGQTMGTFDVPGRKLGLCLDNCTLYFRDVACK